MLPVHECLLTNRQYCVSSPELHNSAVIPRSCTFRVSRQTFDLMCLSNPPSRNSHRWFSLSSHIRITTIDPLAYESSVKQRSWCFSWPLFVMVHSWFPPVSWHWYTPVMYRLKRNFWIRIIISFSTQNALNFRNTYRLYRPSNDRVCLGNKYLAAVCQRLAFQV